MSQSAESCSYNISQIFAFVSRDFNYLYEIMESDETFFHKEFLSCLRSKLNKKTMKEVMHSLKQHKRGGIHGKRLIGEFRRVYDNFFSFQLRCFYQDNETDNYDTLRQFRQMYEAGRFGCTSYLFDKMSNNCRDERLMDLISLIQEDSF